MAVLCLLVTGCAIERQVVLDAKPAPPNDPPVRSASQRVIDWTRPVAGNRVELLRDGAEAYPAMFAAMQHATDSINLEFYIFLDVNSGGRTLSDVLVDRLHHGVAVSIMYDPVGSIAIDPAFLNRLAQAGAVITAFDPLLLALSGRDNPNHRDHRKILVVDGRIAFLGGINFDPVYENPPSSGSPSDDLDRAYWQDTAIRVTGPVVANLQRVFFDTWAKHGGLPLRSRNWFPPLTPVGDKTVSILASEPGDGHPLFYVWLLHALRAARHSIDLCTGYFVPSHQLRQELNRAARRGVDVRLVVPGYSDSYDALALARAAYGDLLESGAHIHEIHSAVLHSKFVIIDGALVAIGSSNLDHRSALFNNEVDAIVVGSPATEWQALFNHEIAMAQEVDQRSWRVRPISERLREWRARLFELLL